jgi:hypothetical protein
MIENAEMSVCLKCFNSAAAKLKMNTPARRPLLTYDSKTDTLKIFRNIDELKRALKKPESSLPKYGVLTRNVDRLSFDLYSSKSFEWITEKDTENKYIYYEIYLMWRETGKIINIRDSGRMKHIRENQEFLELMKNNKGKEFVLMDEYSVYLLHDLLYDRKNITSQWFSSVEELTDEIYSGKYYSDVRTIFSMTEEFKKHYKNTQKELAARIKINRFG